MVSSRFFGKFFRKSKGKSSDTVVTAESSVKSSAASSGIATSSGTATHRIKEHEAHDSNKGPNNLTKELQIKAAKALIECYGDPNLTPEKFAKIWVNGTDKRYIYEDGLSFSPNEMVGLLQMTRASFCDFRMIYQTIKVVDAKNVTIEGAFCLGTHTGAPFSPGPGFPPIEAAGVEVKNDEERFWLELDENGKIEKCNCYSLGIVSGPVGFYEQISAARLLAKNANNEDPLSTN